jgi:anthranilate phosphoribosyltransferase
MSIAPYIKEIGRGKEGARSLTREQAYDLMSRLLDGKVSDLEIGAFALAMRIKGESVAELSGFVDAVSERCMPIPTDAPTVLLPSYNGARKLPNLTVLLAMLLAQEGVQVLVHGPVHDPNRVTTAEVFFDLGLPIARDAADVHAAWARREPVFLRTEALCEPLARLLDVRWVVGLRNSGHTVAKVLPVCPGALRVVNYTHPEYATLLADYLAASHADALLMRGTEGEPVADARRTPRVDAYVAGQLRPELGLAAHDGVLTTLPVLPRSQDAATTARYVQSVVSGAVPAPQPIVNQVELVLRALAAMRAAAARECSA